MRWIALCLLVFAVPPAAATEALLETGFDHYFNLEYDEALEVFRKVAKDSPGKAASHTNIAQGILYRELFRVGALESELVSGSNSFLRRPKMQPGEADRLEFEESIRRALELTSTALETEPDDIDALYVRGVAFGLKANYDFLVRKAWMDALRSATRSRKLHARIKAAAMARGLMCYPMGGTIDGQRGDHVLLAPPFIIDDEHVAEIVDKLGDAVDSALAEVA